MSDTPSPISPPESTPSPTAPGPLAALLLDQRRRWQTGECVPVEHYVERHPVLRDDAGALLDLIYNEVVLREQHGEAPGLDEYVQRFPSLAGPLRLQFAMDRALGEALAPGGASSGARATVRVAAPAPASPEMPSVAGYEMLGVLGKGGMGVAYKAWHAPLKRVVALKVIRAGDEAGPDELARFRTEAEAVGRLQHPNIVQVFEVGEHQGRPYLALEYLDGGSLDALLNGAPWPARQGALLVETLARAVQHAHERGVLHRDLKPANVLLAADGTPKVADFGLAKLSMRGASQTLGEAILGTPSYMAPEQAGAGAKQVGPPADVYALGSILYELLTGRPPFRAATLLETMLLVRTEEPVPPARLQPKTPRDLETIALKCLHKDPARRYASALDLADDLGRFLAGEPIRARPVGPAGRLARWCRRNRAVAGLLLAVGLLFVSGLAVTTALWLHARRQSALAEGSARAAGDERDRAEENFRLTLQAVEEYLTRVGDSEELKAHGLEKLRQSLLETANVFYQSFVERQRDDPKLQFELGKAYGRLAYISGELGEAERAVELYGRMKDLFTALAGAYPDDLRYRQNLALSLSNLGNHYRSLGRWDDAERAGLEALPLREQLCRDAPDTPDYLSDVAETHTMLAVLYGARGRWDDSEASHKEARRLRTQLWREHPASARYQAGLAVTLTNLGAVYQETGRPKEAEASYQEARALQAELGRKHPHDPKYQASLAATHVNLGVSLLAEGRAAEAMASYELARNLLAELTRAHPYVSVYRYDCAVCGVNLGALYLYARQWGQAEKVCQEARTLYADLARERPHLPEYQFGLSQACNNLFRVFHSTNRPREAEAAALEAHKALEALCADHPRVPDYQKALAANRLNLGALYASSGRIPEAEAAWVKARTTLTELCGAHSGVPEYQSLLAGCHNNLGTVYHDLDRPSEAEAAYKEALKIQERLWQDHRGRPGYAVDLADTCGNLASLDVKHRRFEKAIEWCDRAVPPLQEVLRKADGHAGARQSLCNAHWNRAIALNGLGRHADAVKDWDRTLQFDTGGQRDFFRLRRTVCLARAGEHARAAAEADDLARTRDATGDTCYSLACAYALASAVARQDVRLPTDERTRSAERHATCALEMLGRAAAAGYFKTAASVEHMKKDADLDPLRSRADFKSWLTGL